MYIYIYTYISMYVYMDKHVDMTDVQERVQLTESV